MTQITDEILTAYADGEAALEVRQIVERALESDPSVRDVLARYRALKGEIDRAYRPVLLEPVPVRLLEAAGVNTVAPMIRRAPPSRWLMPMAMAASLVIGVSAGALLMRAPAPHDGGIFVANADTSNALATLRDGESREGLRVIASYEDSAGQFCRRFEVVGDRSSSDALACRSADGRLWRFAALEPRAPEGAYMPAGDSVSGITVLVAAMRPLAEAEVETLLTWK